MLRRLTREEAGFGLIELLISLTILAIGIMTIVAGFSSGMVALVSASRASTAAAVADARMEGLRRVRFSAIGPPSATPTDTSPTGPDGRTYWMRTDFKWQCPLDGTTSTTAAAPACPDVAGAKSRAVKLVRVDVRDGSATAKLLVTESSTFDEATG